MSLEKAKASAAQAAEEHLQELRVDSLSPPRRHSSDAWKEKERLPKTSSRSSDYVYVNRAFDGSDVRPDSRLDPVPVTSVIREQYWTCSKWPIAQRILAIAVGVLVGAVVGLAVTMVIMGKGPDEVIGNILPDISRGAES